VTRRWPRSEKKSSKVVRVVVVSKVVSMSVRFQDEATGP
jgi:hypothetical protein